MKAPLVGGLALLAAVGVAACGGEGEAASAHPAPAPAEAPSPQPPPTPLEAETVIRDLGTVGIGDGLVETEFVFRNAADAPADLEAAYTSCMCTEVTLAFEDGSTMGPFGMPGHDLPVTLERTLEPGEEVTAQVVFDPMAHGPEAVGRVQRAIALHTADGALLRLDFTINVVKDAGTP